MLTPPSHRERKAADTRLKLVEALLLRLDDRALVDIPVKELCAAAGVSPATFFNYFETKADLVWFFLRLWSIEMAGVVDAHPHDDPLGAIEAMFERTGRQSDRQPGMLAEIIAQRARNRLVDAGPEPTDADVLRAFPDRPELVAVPRSVGLQALLPPRIERAISLGQLPRHTDPSAVLLGVVTIFFGAGIVRRQRPGLSAETAYGAQLRQLWAAFRSAGPPRD